VGGETLEAAIEKSNPKARVVSEAGCFTLEELEREDVDFAGG
jgi:hypothetical protein